MNKSLFGIENRKSGIYMKRCDLHVHTHYSYDTKEEQTIDGYCLKGIERGVDIICFTDHIEYCKAANTFDEFAFEKRMEEYRQAKEKYQNQIKILLGFEMGQPHLHPQIVEKLRAQNPDMIIGSIHYAENDAITYDEASREKWYRWYDQMVYDMIECANVDVIGHLDLLRKWNREMYIPDKEMQKKSVKRIVEKGLVPEINTASLRSGLDEPMPGFDIIEYYRDCGGKYVTVNSDAHRIDDLSCDWQRVVDRLPEGLRLCYFEKGKRVEL